MNIEVCEARLATLNGRQAKVGSDYIVHAGKVCPVGQIEGFSQDLQVCSFADFEAARKTQVKVNVIGTQTGITRCANWTIIGGMVISVYIRASQQVKRMTAVVAENGSNLETRENAPTLMTSVYNGCKDDFVPLIEVGKSALKSQVRVVLGTKVTVEVRSGIKGLAQRVTRQN